MARELPLVERLDQQAARTLTPVKFGISFTVTHLNQAGALLHVYTDGSVHLNHGGTEMGQGLMVKVAQLVTEELQIDLDRVKISATNTGKVPHTFWAQDGQWATGTIAPGQSRTVTFDKVGEFTYTCREHPWTIGQVIID